MVSKGSLFIVGAVLATFRLALARLQSISISTGQCSRSWFGPAGWAVVTDFEKITVEDDFGVPARQGGRVRLFSPAP
jgi:hypothetical protein